MAEPTFTEQMIAKLEALLLENPGVDRISLPDGRSVSYRDLKAELEYWRRRAAQETAARPRLASINLGG